MEPTGRNPIGGLQSLVPAEHVLSAEQRAGGGEDGGWAAGGHGGIVYMFLFLLILLCILCYTHPLRILSYLTLPAALAPSRVFLFFF